MANQLRGKYLAIRLLEQSETSCRAGLACKSHVRYTSIELHRTLRRRGEVCEMLGFFRQDSTEEASQPSCCRALRQELQANLDVTGSWLKGNPIFTSVLRPTPRPRRTFSMRRLSSLECGALCLGALALSERRGLGFNQEGMAIRARKRSQEATKKPVVDPLTPCWNSVLSWRCGRRVRPAKECTIAIGDIDMRLSEEDFSVFVLINGVA